MKYRRFGRVSYSAMNCGVETSSNTYSIHQTRNHQAVARAAQARWPNHGENTAGSAITMDSRHTSMRSPPTSSGASRRRHAVPLPESQAQAAERQQRQHRQDESQGQAAHQAALRVAIEVRAEPSAPLYLIGKAMPSRRREMKTGQA